MILVILGGVGAGLIFKATSHFVIASAVIGLLFGFSNASNFAARHGFSIADVKQKNNTNAVVAAFVNAFVIAFAASLICGAIARAIV